MTAQIINFNQYKQEKMLEAPLGYRGLACCVYEDLPTFWYDEPGVKMPSITVTVDFPEEEK